MSSRLNPESARQPECWLPFHFPGERKHRSLGFCFLFAYFLTLCLSLCVGACVCVRACVRACERERERACVRVCFRTLAVKFVSDNGLGGCMVCWRVDSMVGAWC